MALTIDFFSMENLPVGEGTRYIVRKHLDTLVRNMLADLAAFTLKVNLKERTLCQLYNLIVCAEDAIQPHCEAILKNVVYKNILDEEPEVAARTYKVAELLGLYVRTDYLLPMIISHLTDSESKAVPRFVGSGLTAFSAVVHHST